VLKNQHMRTDGDGLSRRERQVMDILFRRGEATVADVMADLPEPPSYSAVRSILRILAEKGAATYKEDGPRYVYLPAVNARRAREQALQHVVSTFFAGSAAQAVTALLGIPDKDLDEADLARLREAVRTARKGGR